MILFLLACDDPAILSSVADGLGGVVRDDAEPAVATFTSAAALIVEACAAVEVDNYTFTGEGARAFRVTKAEVAVSETTGQRTWNFGEVPIADGFGALTIGSDETRTAYTVALASETAAFTGSFTLLACEGSETGIATRASISGTGTFTQDGEAAALSIGAATTLQALEWVPANAAFPSSGWVHWKGDGTSLLLNPADEIDEISHLWPGIAEGTEGWATDVTVLLP